MLKCYPDDLSKMARQDRRHRAQAVSTLLYRGPIYVRPRPRNKTLQVSAQTPDKSSSAVLTTPDGRSLPLAQATFAVGSNPGNDLQVSDPAVQEQHAVLENRSGSLYLTALHGDPEDITSQSLTWLNGSPLRPGVAYLLGTGAELEFGSQGAPYKLQFDQKEKSSPMMEMLMKNMAANEDVRRQLEQD